jgi:5'-nucleotidase
VALIGTAVLLTTCLYTSDTPDITGRDIRLTIFHTSDIHSRLTPYDWAPMYTEQKIGLVPDRGPYGGIARIAHLIKRERALAGRSLYVDSGDLFQGAPIFNHFHGEPEVRALSHAGVDVFTLGNHEFDVGPVNVATQFEGWADFPVLASNYKWELASEPHAEQFAGLVKPFVIFNIHGLKVGVIGMGNTSSMTSLEEGGNSLGILPLATIQTLQDQVSQLRDQVDLVIALSHMGLGEDEAMAENVCGIDLILGGHHHVALDPPKVIEFDPDPALVQGEHEDADYDADEEQQTGNPAIDNCSAEHRRSVIMSHPHAFAKFVARIDLVVRDGRIRSHAFRLFPIDRTVPEDPDVAEVLEDYLEELDLVYDLDRVVTHASENIRRFGTYGGDSMLGNLVCEAMQYREHVETDFCVTNSLGMRTDILEGDVTYETMFNVLPFENTITTMYLSGVEVQVLLDYATARSAGRGCNSQIQVSNLSFTMNCRTGLAEDIEIAGAPITPEAIYEMATNNYIAWGGSGFEMLEINTTKQDTGIAMRDAVIDYMRQHDELPVCYAQDGESGVCTSGLGVEDGRIKPAY